MSGDRKTDMSACAVQGADQLPCTKIKLSIKHIENCISSFDS